MCGPRPSRTRKMSTWLPQTSAAGRYTHCLAPGPRRPSSAFARSAHRRCRPPRRPRRHRSLRRRRLFLLRIRQHPQHLTRRPRLHRARRGPCRRRLRNRALRRNCLRRRPLPRHHHSFSRLLLRRSAAGTRQASAVQSARLPPRVGPSAAHVATSRLRPTRGGVGPAASGSRLAAAA